MRNRYTKRLAFWTLVLFVLWLLLSESFEPAHMAVGLASSFVVALLSRDPSVSRTYTVRWMQALLYFPWLFSRIFLSGLHLSYLILHPRLPIKRVLRHASDSKKAGGGDADGRTRSRCTGTVSVEPAAEELLMQRDGHDRRWSVGAGRLESKVTGGLRVREATGHENHWSMTLIAVLI